MAEFVAPSEAEQVGHLRYYAAKLKSHLPRHVDLEDLVQWGWFGLRGALADFDPDRGVKFWTYAGVRIRGAMLDGIRGLDWVPRLARCRGETGPAVRSLSAMLGINDTGREWRAQDILPDYRPPRVDVEQADAIEQMLAVLPKQHRLPLRMIYAGGVTMHEAGRALGLSMSRVSQLHSQAIAIMKARLVLKEDGTVQTDRNRGGVSNGVGRDAIHLRRQDRSHPARSRPGLRGG